MLDNPSRLEPWFVQTAPEVIRWRHDFHAHPEIGFQEARTSERIAQRLASWGIEVHHGIGGTGVVGVLHGRKENGRTIGLRAEMDALPMDEQGDVPYRSTRHGTFHGCGHDGHSAVLLAVARLLAERRDFDGTVHFIFQPGEETLAGARAMLADGLFERFPCDEIYAFHNHPLYPPGTVCINSGIVLASADSLEINIAGIGAHGAMPHTGIDPIVVGASLVQQFQTIVSRSVDPLESAVVTLGTFHAGTVGNVIPAEATLTGTVRSLSNEARDLVKRRIEELCAGTAQSFGARISCTFGSGCPPTRNGVVQAQAVERIARDVVGAANVACNVPPVMAAEDFSFMLERRPGAYFLVGQRGRPCHHPEYDFDDSIIPIAGTILLRIVHERLNEPPRA